MRKGKIQSFHIAIRIAFAEEMERKSSTVTSLQNYFPFISRAFSVHVESLHKDARTEHIHIHEQLLRIKCDNICSGIGNEFCLVACRHVTYFLCLRRFVPESLRWLVMHRKYNQAEKVLQTAARFNGTDLPKVLFLDCMDGGGLACKEPGRNVRSYTDNLPASNAKEIEANEKSVDIKKDTGCDGQSCTALDMFRTPKLRRWSCVFAFNW